MEIQSILDLLLTMISLIYKIVLKNQSSLLEVNIMNKRLLLAHPKFRRIANQIEIWIQKLLALAVQQLLKEEIHVEIPIRKFLLQRRNNLCFKISKRFSIKYRLHWNSAKCLYRECSLRKINRDQNYNLEPKFIEIIEFGAETV